MNSNENNRDLDNLISHVYGVSENDEETILSDLISRKNQTRQLRTEQVVQELVKIVSKNQIQVNQLVKKVNSLELELSQTKNLIKSSNKSK